MKTIDVERILKTAGRDGASAPVPSKRHRIFRHETYVMEPNDRGEEHEVDVFVVTPSRWKAISSGKRWRCDEFSVVNCGPFVVAVRVSR